MGYFTINSIVSGFKKVDQNQEIIYIAFFKKLSSIFIFFSYHFSPKAKSTNKNQKHAIFFVLARIHQP